MPRQPTSNPSNKRRACDSCGKARVKCSGDQPCKRCIEKEIDCEYSQARRKGMIRGKIALLEQRVKQLEHELKIESCICSMYDSYKQVYKSTLLPFTSLTFPDISTTDFYNETGDYSKMLATGIMAYISQAVGDNVRAHEFHLQSQSFMKDYYDATHPLIVATHGITCSYYGNAGEMDKAVMHCQLALSMKQQLMKKGNDTPGSIGIFATFLSSLKMVEESCSRESLEKALSFIKNIIELESQSNEIHAFTVSLVKIHVKLISQIDLVDCINDLDVAELSIPTNTDSLLRSVFTAIIHSGKATAYFHLGMKEKALQLCDKTLEVLSSRHGVKTPLICGSLTYVAQIYYYYGVYDSLYTVAEQLYRYGTPISNAMSAWVQCPASIENDNTFSFLSVANPFEKQRLIMEKNEYEELNT